MTAQLAVNDTTPLMDQVQSIVHQFVHNSLNHQLADKNSMILALEEKLKKCELDMEKKNKIFNGLSMAQLIDKCFPLNWADVLSHGQNPTNFIFAIETGKLIKK
jgi:hypothetical protein